MANDALGITAKKAENVADWYEQVCLKSELVDFGEIKGTMVIRPRGYYIWQQVQDQFNKFIEKLGVENAYFPMFIPERLFKLEATHAHGFAPELAWVATNDNNVGEDKAILRPTSEAIIADSFRKWLRSHKQLPMKLNQWCNICRWETKQTKLFLRSREFLWQEGHCIYKTKEECVVDVLKVRDEYARIAKDLLAVPTIIGEKSAAERFAGAVNTYTFEGFMPDGKALQMGTSHYLGQGFMKAFNVLYKDESESDTHPHYNSWGFSTRMLGAVIMTHSDDKGLVLPPRLVKQKVVIIPVLRKEIPAGFNEYIEAIVAKTGGFVDNRTDYSMGWKLNEWELKGVPLIIIVGAQEFEKGQITLKFRDVADKQASTLAELNLDEAFNAMHERLYTKANQRMQEQIVRANTLDEFKSVLEQNKVALVPFFDDSVMEKKIDTDFGVGTRCLIDAPDGSICVFSGKATTTLAYFSKSY